MNSNYISFYSLWISCYKKQIKHNISLYGSYTENQIVAIARVLTAVIVATTTITNSNYKTT